MDLYNYPSINSNICVSKLTKEISKEFVSLYSDYMCCAGYDYEDGSFRGDSYKELFKEYFNTDLTNTLSTNEIKKCLDIFNNKINLLKLENRIFRRDILFLKTLLELYVKYNLYLIPVYKEPISYDYACFS